MRKVVIIAVGVYLMIIAVNGLLSFGRSSSEEQVFLPKFKFSQPDRPLKKKYSGEIVRKNRVVPGMDFEESIFYAGGEEIARQKIVHGKIVETTGEIPDGKVRFVDDYHSSYGDEFYSRGKKHGMATTYYKDGKLKAESEYLLGRLIYNKEFYNDGAVRMEEHYEDAMVFPDEPNRETGIGKLYFRDGTLKYEWSFVRGHPANYKKSYNRDGDLTLELYFDKDGNPIRQ